jgi:DNA gyrase subunit A
VVREHQELVFISQNGMVQRTSVRGINRYGRTSQGVRVMNLREGDEVSAVALVVESDESANGQEAIPTLEPTDSATVDAATDEGGVITVEPTAEDDDETLQPPEITDEDMPDSDIEE